MKKISMLLVSFFICVISFSQITIKGYEMGTVYDGDEMISTTLGGIPGGLFINTLNDGRIYGFFFVPSEDGETVNRVYTSDVVSLKEGFENKYEINFKKVGDDSDYYYKYKGDGYEIYLLVDYNRYMDVPCKLSVSIDNIELKKIHKEEEQGKKNDDF